MLHQQRSTLLEQLAANRSQAERLSQEEQIILAQIRDLSAAITQQSLRDAIAHHGKAEEKE